MKNKVVREFCGTRVTVEHLPEPKRCRGKVKVSNSKAVRQLVGFAFFFATMVCVGLIDTQGWGAGAVALVLLFIGGVLCSEADVKAPDKKEDATNGI